MSDWHHYLVLLELGYLCTQSGLVLGFAQQKIGETRQYDQSVGLGA